MIKHLFLRLLCLSIFFIPILSSEASFQPILSKKNKVKPFNTKRNEPPYYVSSANNGQLANQLFCVATTLAYAWDNDLIPVFPFLNTPDAGKSFNRDHIFFRLNTMQAPKSLSRYTNRKIDYIPIPSAKDVFLDGPFFSWRYFHHRREKLLEILAPSETILSYLHNKYADLITLPNTVAIHVRTTSHSVHKNSFPFPGLNYFELAISHFPEDSIFVVFSDRIKWCKKNFSERFPDKTFIFIEGNNHIQDLFLLSMMKHHILSNLTFSWWGAYLNTNPEQIVYVPARQAWRQWPIKDYYLPEWNVIEKDFSKDPYPADMYDYDKASTSLHEQRG